MFENVLLATSGLSIYQRGLENLNGSLHAAEADLLVTFKRLAELKPYITRLPAGTELQTVADHLRKDQAGMVIQGDWLRGELTTAGLIANQQFYCFEVPGEHRPVAYALETVAALKNSNEQLTPNQTTFFQAQMVEDMQYLFNNYNGGLPAMNDVGLEKINECVALTIERIDTATRNEMLVPSILRGSVVRPTILAAITDVAHEFMTQEIAPEEAVDLIRKRVKRAALQ
jgi:glucose/mannose transport system substrate-binding protein